jgi:hypothetical protein
MSMTGVSPGRSDSGRTEPATPVPIAVGATAQRSNGMTRVSPTWYLPLSGTRSDGQRAERRFLHAPRVVRSPLHPPRTANGFEAYRLPRTAMLRNADSIGKSSQLLRLTAVHRIDDYRFLLSQPKPGFARLLQQPATSSHPAVQGLLQVDGANSQVRPGFRCTLPACATPQTATSHRPANPAIFLAARPSIGLSAQIDEPGPRSVIRRCRCSEQIMFIAVGENTVYRMRRRISDVYSTSDVRPLHSRRNSCGINSEPAAGVHPRGRHVTTWLD